jgi:S1-C subfamily serine protease
VQIKEGSAEAGGLVVDVSPSAQNSGLVKGCVVTAVNGEPTETGDQLIAALQEFSLSGVQIEVTAQFPEESDELQLVPEDVVAKKGFFSCMTPKKY